MKFKIKYADQIVGILSLLAIIALIFIIFLIGSTQKWFVPKHNCITTRNFDMYPKFWTHIMN